MKLYMIPYVHVKYKMLHATKNHVKLVLINCQWQLQNVNFLLITLLWWSSDQFEEINDLWKLSSIWIKILNEIAWLLNWIELKLIHVEMHLHKCHQTYKPHRSSIRSQVQKHIHISHLVMFQSNIPHRGLIGYS
jgi:hypothetical protein